MTEELEEIGLPVTAVGRRLMRQAYPWLERANTRSRHTDATPKAQHAQPVDRNFTDQPNQKWAGDITYI
jgi:hypothetical protein